MYEHLRNDFAVKLSMDYGRKDMDKILSILDRLIKDYDITDKCTALSVFQDQTPKELKAYIASKRLEGLSELTLQSYYLYLSGLYRNLGLPTDQITTNDIRLYLATYQAKRKTSDRTLDKIRQVFNNYFTWLTDEEYIAKNPCRNIHGIKYEVAPRRSLTREQLERLRRICKSPKERAIVDVLFSTACRVSELVNMKLSDIDTNNRTVHIIGKGGKHNTVYLNASSWLSIQEYLGSRKGDSEYLFSNDNRPYNKISVRSVQLMFKGFGNDLGIPLSPHIIRHTTATLALQSGMEITQVQKLLNHANVSTTQIYAETSQQDVMESHKKYVV